MPTALLRSAPEAATMSLSRPEPQPPAIQHAINAQDLGLCLFAMLVPPRLDRHAAGHSIRGRPGSRQLSIAHDVADHVGGQKPIGIHKIGIEHQLLAQSLSESHSTPLRTPCPTKRPEATLAVASGAGRPVPSPGPGPAR